MRSGGTRDRQQIEQVESCPPATVGLPVSAEEEDGEEGGTAVEAGAGNKASSSVKVLYVEDCRPAIKEEEEDEEEALEEEEEEEEKGLRAGGGESRRKSAGRHALVGMRSISSIDRPCRINNRLSRMGSTPAPGMPSKGPLSSCRYCLSKLRTW